MPVAPRLAPASSTAGGGEGTFLPSDPICYLLHSLSHLRLPNPEEKDLPSEIEPPHAIKVPS